MEKSKLLYHGTPNKNIATFEPRAEKIRDVSEGPKVFATPDKRFASAFIIGVDDSWANSGSLKGLPYLVISDRARFEKLDQGGAIYHLPSDTFETDPDKGLGALEWTSDHPVVPSHKEEHHSALDAMLEHGVQVYFVDPETYQKWRTAPDHGLALMKTLISENQKRNINPAPFE